MKPPKSNGDEMNIKTVDNNILSPQSYQNAKVQDYVNPHLLLMTSWLDWSFMYLLSYISAE